MQTLAHGENVQRVSWLAACQDTEARAAAWSRENLTDLLVVERQTDEGHDKLLDVRDAPFEMLAKRSSMTGTDVCVLAFS